MEDIPVRIKSPDSTGRHNSSKSVSTPPSAGAIKKNRSKLITKIVGAAILFLIAVIGGWFIYRTTVGLPIDTSKYQAVFFTNGQVYFGKLQSLNNGYFKMDDIFYLQSQTSTTTTDSKNPQQTSSQQTPDVQLIKLGSEIHGPDDEMIVSKDQVLFFENLKKDGKVAASIAKYHSQNK
jgi:hypothetical protein